MLTSLIFLPSELGLRTKNLLLPAGYDKIRTSYEGGENMDAKKVLIAMSGGVDSSVAAYLMMENGYDCVGGTMRMCDTALLGCEPSDPAQDAKKVADRLGIPFHVFDAFPEFKKWVAEPFICSYEQGDTPNPCIQCNKHMKFGLLLEKALALGCDKIVTGHYARIVEKDGRFLLQKAVDESKDQTYFLACLSQEQLSHICLPLGSLTKPQVREIAEAQDFITARKKDSQDICFIPDGDYKVFMERYGKKCYPAGDYLDMDGKVIGRHQGAVGYTLGQRKGLGIALGAPAYVCQKDMENNTVTLGTNEDLFKKVLRANDWNFSAFDDLKEPMRVMAKVRYRHTPQPATVYPEEDGYCRVEFDEPQRAITTGQAVVLYDGDLVVGGGTITEVI